MSQVLLTQPKKSLLFCLNLGKSCLIIAISVVLNLFMSFLFV
uniref:Uncharacterized protein n=1 Tax=Rhizophora mucronata TaxID=61149 RepID=A0A2P2PRP2_RHIMU